MEQIGTGSENRADLRQENFGPPTRVSTTTSSLLSSEADTRGTGGQFHSRYSPGSRVTLGKEDYREIQHSSDCFIELASDAKDARLE